MAENIRFGGADRYKSRIDETKFPIVEMARSIKRITTDLICFPAKLEESIARRKKK